MIIDQFVTERGPEESWRDTGTLCLLVMQQVDPSCYRQLYYLYRDNLHFRECMKE